MGEPPEPGPRGLYPYVLENLDIGIWAVDKEGDFIYFNKAMEGMTGVKREDILGQNLFSIFGRLDRVSPEFKKRFFEAQQTLKPQHYERMRFVRPDGSVGHQYGTFCPMKDEKGELLGMITIVEDVTEKLAPEGEGKRSGLEVERKEPLEDMEMADLLNSLSVILAYTEVMMEEETREDRILDLKTIKENAERVSDLLKNLTWEGFLGRMRKEGREKS